MKLSIIIPIYNVEEYITRCLDSVLDQGLDISEYEIILINDGSTDNSISIVQNYLNDHSNIKLYNQENKGIAATRNVGMKLSKGDYIYFIDSDDYLAKGALKTILFYAYQGEFDILTFNSNVTTSHDLEKSNTNNDDVFTLSKMSGINYIGKVGFRNEVWWYFIKRDYLNKLDISFVEGRWVEDAIFTATLFVNASNMAHIPIDAHRYFIRGESIMTSTDSKRELKMIDDMKDVVIKYKTIINSISFSAENKLCIERLKCRQQSFVFFLMSRILRSTIKLKEIKLILNELKKAEAYPMNLFLGVEYNSLIYHLLVPIFNRRFIYFLFFLIFNPLIRLKKSIVN